MTMPAPPGEAASPSAGGSPTPPSRSSSQVSAAGGPPRRRRSHARHWIAAVLLLPLAALAAGEMLGWRFLRGPIEAQATRALGVPVTLAPPFRLHLLGTPRVAVGGLHLGAAPGSGAPFLLEASGLELRAGWGALRATLDDGRLRLQRLAAQRIESHLLRRANGPPSWQLRPPEPQAPQDAPPPWPQVDVVELREARLHVDDALTRLQLEARLSLDESQPRAGGAAMASGAAVASPTASASAPARGSPDAATPGFRATAEGRWRGAAVSASLTAPAVLPVLAAPGAAPLDVVARAQLGATRASYEGRLSDLLGALDLAGRVEASGPSLAAAGAAVGITLPSTPPFRLAGTLTRQGAVYEIEVATATVGTSDLRGHFRFDPRGARPRLDGALEGRRLVLADLAPSVGAGGGSPATPAKPTTPPAVRPDGSTTPAATPPRRVLPDRRFDLPSLRAMDADVRFALDRLDLGPGALESLAPLRGHLRLDDGLLRIDELLATTAGGTLSGSTSLDGRPARPRWQADLRWRDVDLAGWARGLRTEDAQVDARSSRATLARERGEARRADAPVRAYVTGELRGGARLSGEGRSVAEILASLDGTLQTRLVDGSLSHLVVEGAGLDLAQALGVVVRGDRPLPLRCGIVALTARQGVVQPQLALLDTADSRIVVDGRIDLRDETLDLRAVSQPKDASPFSLRSPLLIGGTLATPQPSVEAAPLVGRAIAAALLATLSPAAAVLPFIEFGGDEDPGRACLPEQKAGEAASPGRPRAPGRAASGAAAPGRGSR